MSIGYGYKAKIGQLYPSGGQTEYEPQMMAPEGVQFITTRLPFTSSRLEDDIALVEDLERSATLLAHAKVDLILLNCTAASLVVGPDVINKRVEETTGIPSVTTIEGVMAALQATKMKRIVLMTAYVDEVVDAEVEYLEARGYEVVARPGIACTNPIDQGAVDPQRWLDLARSCRDVDADGMLISCAGIRIGGVLGELEQGFGRPVVASNQAALWECLRRLQVADRPRGYGSLLEGTYD